MLVHLTPDTVFVEGDSIVIRNMKLTETAYLSKESLSPKILIMGSSRLVGTEVEILSSQTGLPLEKVHNLSTPGATFFFIESFLRRHPKTVEELELLVIDILPYQVMRTSNFQESDPYFLRYATLDQRFNAESTTDCILATSDFAIPAWSRSQPPSAWMSGFRRSNMDLPALEADISRRPRQDFPNWGKLIALMAEARKTENGAQKLNAGIFFSTANVARNQVDALSKILDLVPENCRVALVWLPLSASTLEIIEDSPQMIESRDTFNAIIDALNHPKLKVYRYETPEQIGINNSDYTNDGIHFKPKGRRKITRTIANMYQK
jgi:hypothetical protein